MNVAIHVNPNAILDGADPEDKLKAAMAAERELVILESASGRREFIETGKNAHALAELVQTRRLQLIRSKSLDGPYYLGLFDQQGYLRILVCRARSIPSAPSPYRLLVGNKEVVSEYLESARPVYGTAGVICVCTTTF